jgi:bifunctional UDP-N-acetylglucosamine pyrophosphorylase/glucosamine-1-phosphate N-acetyltransferase
MGVYEKMEEPVSNQINAGIYHFNKTVFRYIDQTRKSIRGEFEITESINLMCKKETMVGVGLSQWRDVGYPWDLLDANEQILNMTKRDVCGEVGDNVTLEGEISLGEGSVILSNCYIEGPVCIGDHCKIGPNCYIRPCTSIGSHCHVGNACEIKNSIIMDSSNIPHQNYVGDSVIGHGCNLGAGAKIANLRLDKKNIWVVLNGRKIKTDRRKLGAILGDNVQTGINSMIDVGTLIGNDVFLGPGAIAHGEILPHSKLI